MTSNARDRTKQARQSAYSTEARPIRKGRKKRLRYLAIAAVIGLLLFAGCFGWLALKANQIHASLTKSASLADQLGAEVLNGEPENARKTFATLQGHTATARAAGTDPVWRAAGNLPFIGSNFAAVSEIAVSAHDVVNSAVGPLLEASEAFDWGTLAPSNGSVDIASIENISPRLGVAADTVRLSHDRLSRMEEKALLPQVAIPLREATRALDETSEVLTDAAAAADVLPSMLGAEEAKNYLLLIQNSAEVRATGGIPGALAVVHAADGKIELKAQETASQLGLFDPPVIVDPEQAIIYSQRMGQYMQSANLTPDFPTAARTAADMWEQRYPGSQIDGVIALDPIVLSHILEATGPVQLAFHDPLVNDLLASSGLPKALTAQNVVPVLLSDVYAVIDDPRLQDAYFAAVAAEVFKSVVSGQGDGRALIGALTRSADEDRLYIWSGDQVEQEVIASTGLAGTVTGAGSGGASFGAYFNDGTGAKMDFYIRRTVQLERSCTPEGYLQYSLVATLTNTAPTDAAEVLPEYVTGGGVFGVPPGTVETNFVAYGPDQARLQTARIDGEQVPLGSYRHGDRPVGTVTTELRPGQSATVELDFTGVVQTSDPILHVTPTIQPLEEVLLPTVSNGQCH